MYLGIDLGTSSVKVLVMDKAGKIIDTATSKYPLYFPKPGFSEQQPADWWSGTKEAILTITNRFPNLGNQIEGISFSGQMHGLVLLDENGNVLHPAILWNDGRTEKECDYLNDVIGKDKLSAYTGNIALCGFTGPKVVWVKEHLPDVFSQIKHILLPKDYIRYKLTGQYIMDVSDASGTLFFDVKNKCWSQEMLSLLSIDEAWLPDLCESYHINGAILEDVAKDLNLNPLTKIVGGGGDQAAGAVGTGTVSDGTVSIALGTSGVVFASTNDYKVDATNRLHSFCHANGKYTQMGVILSAAYCLQWWVEEVNKNIDTANPYQVLCEEASKVPAGSEGLIFLPYLTGERTPHGDVNARGTFIGLSPTHTRGHMTRAIMEGVGYALRDSLEILKDMGISISECRITGGGTRNALWLEIIASILNVSLNIVEAAEGPAYGAAILAAVGCGAYPTIEEACKALIHTSHTVVVNSDDVAIYEKNYAIYKMLYPALQSSFKALSESLSH
ncbi:MAG: xylulokinase [Cellulosilyticaceae bacterium]